MNLIFFYIFSPSPTLPSIAAQYINQENEIKVEPNFEMKYEVKSEYNSTKTESSLKYFFRDMENVFYLKKRSSTAYCLYCGLLFSDVFVHMKSKHSIENLVKQFFSTVNRFEKRRLSIVISNYGNHLHNEKVLEAHIGEIILSELLKKEPATSAEVDFCSSCFLWTPDLKKHSNQFCRLKPSDNEISG